MQSLPSPGAAADGLQASMYKVVLDTNVIVSAALKSSGLEADVLRIAVAEDMELCISPEILGEYKRVLAKSRLKLSAAATTQILTTIQTRSTLFVPTRRLSVSPDESDNRFLECAEAASADFLITGNRRHFPDNHGVTKVLTAREFLADITTR